MEFFLDGGKLDEFDKLWGTVNKRTETKILGYKNKTLCSAGREMLYLISGTK